MKCEICGKPPSGYPNWIQGKGHAYHVGCVADAYDKLKDAVEKVIAMEVGVGYPLPVGDGYGECSECEEMQAVLKKAMTP